MEEITYSKERLLKSGILKAGEDVIRAALPDGEQMTVEQAERLIRIFLKRKVCG